jgi:hypothetical protein
VWQSPSEVAETQEPLDATRTMKAIVAQQAPVCGFDKSSPPFIIAATILRKAFEMKNMLLLAIPMVLAVLTSSAARLTAYSQLEISSAHDRQPKRAPVSG